MALTFLREAIKTYKDRDPAARSSLDFVLCYPGVHVVVWHELPHTSWMRHLYTLGRFPSHIGRWLTGLDIHPAVGKNVIIGPGQKSLVRSPWATTRALD